MKLPLIVVSFIFVYLYCEEVITSDSEGAGVYQSVPASLERDIRLDEQNVNVRILHREKRTIFGFLSFLVLLLNAFLAINLNVNINNNNNNLNDNMNMNENMNMN